MPAQNMTISLTERTVRNNWMRIGLAIARADYPTGLRSRGSDRRVRATGAAMQD